MNLDYIKMLKANYLKGWGAKSWV